MVSGAGREARAARTWAGIPISGVSVAGRETWFHLPTLGIAYDLGRTPSELVPVSNVFLSHAHLDHAGGLAYWASQRRLMRHPEGIVHTEPSAVDAWRRILALHEELEAVRYDARVEPLAPGASVDVRKDLRVTAFRVAHRIPTLGFVASEVRRKLKPEWRPRDPHDVRAAAASGIAVAEEVTIPLVAYSGDTARGFFESAAPEAFRAKVMLLECSFVEERHADRAGQWGHLHVSEIAEHADRFENEVLVLTHLTLRTSGEEIERTIRRELPERLASRTVAFLP